MTKERADLGFSDALDDFDPADWSPRPEPKARPRPPKDEARKAANAAGFRSREPEPEAAQERAGEPAPLRRRRTGRNRQLNLKATPETVETFCAIADQHGWGLGETLEKAVELLRREYS